LHFLYPLRKVLICNKHRLSYRFALLIVFCPSMQNNRKCSFLSRFVFA
jgi:hypothetical protein